MFTTEITSTATPEKAFSAITTNVDKWWTAHANSVSKVGEFLTVKFEKGTFWKMSLTEIIELEKVVWKVEEAHHSLDELSRKDEWLNTEIIWEISPIEEGVSLKFTHKGLDPQLECFEICSSGWQYFLGSLEKYLDTGFGTPFN